MERRIFLYCKFCGEKNDDDAVYCEGCGKKINSEKKKQIEIISEMKNSKNRNHNNDKIIQSNENSSEKVQPSDVDHTRGIIKYQSNRSYEN